LLVQLPDGHRSGRTGEAVKRIEALFAVDAAGRRMCFAIIGFSILDSANERMRICRADLEAVRRPRWRCELGAALIARVFGEGQQIRTAPSSRSTCADHRLSTTGGFEYELEGLEGQEPAAMNSVMQGLVANANHDPRLTRVFSTYTANNPSIYLDIDREKAQALGPRHE